VNIYAEPTFWHRARFAVLKICLVQALVAGSLPLSAWNDTIHSVSVSAGFDLMSRYIWRGEDLGQSPSIQPGLSATWKGFTLGAWGAYKFTGPGEQETDLYVSQKIGFVTLAVWDYWTFSDTASTNYFDYDYKTTRHNFEGQVLLSGGEKFPLSLLGSYFFYGEDHSNSIYLELQFKHSFSFLDLQLFTGFQAKGDYYSPYPAFVNVGCTVVKDLEITQKWSLPVTVSLIMNPYRESLFLVAGITI
jgi:hypothetical protein